MSKHDQKNIFSLEITFDREKIKLSAYTKSSDDEKTVRHYETKDINGSDISKMCSAIVQLLNRTNKRGQINRKTLEELQTSGQLLYDSLLTTHIKKKLAVTKSENLMLILDDHLVHIPWELLFNGKDFLCRRFNMGRLVRTSQSISTSTVRKIKKPLKMLLIADPRNDLDAAYQEGICLRDELDNNLEIVEVDLRSSVVDVTSVKGALRNYDIMHYAGHADYDIKNPSDSGLLMQDGRLTASDIMNMTGSAPLPALVFSNACKSGHTDVWSVGENYETEIYGLANAFLLAGVQHYIGTFWDVQDEPSLYFALDFYRALVKGSTVGGALKKAREGLIEKYGEDTIIWASYMLYGDPTVSYVDFSMPGKTDKKTEELKTRDADNENETEFAGSVRGANTEIVFPRKRQQWMLVASVLLIIIVSIMSFTLLRKDMKPANTGEAYKYTRGKEQETKNDRIDALITALIKEYKEKRKTKNKEVTDTVAAGAQTLVFLNIKANGIAESDTEYIFTRITNTLRKSNRIQVVDRDILDKLLEELRLSTSELASPATALEIGRIMSAQLISTGSISRNGKDWQVSLRFIDTETTTIQSALTESLEAEDKDEVAAILSRKILKELRTE